MAVGLAAVAVAGACLAPSLWHEARAATATVSPTSSLRVCGNKAELARGPRRAPRHSIRVPAGNDARVNWSRRHRTYWFAPGVHTLGAGKYTQILPGHDSVYIGAPGAVITGKHVNYYAFGGNATDVTISYLTIEDFGTLGGNMNEGVVNQDSATGWTISHSTIRDNAGAGIMIGSRNRIAHDCLADNQQYGFNAYSVAGPSNIVLTHNEITGNDTYNWEAHISGCGCTGGGKFWSVNGAIVTHNWVHGNHSVGLWADTNNRGFEIAHNYFQDNYATGLIYEISYNALIKDNVFVRNGLGNGPHNDGFPSGGIYISESGSDSRVPGSFGQSFKITGNTFDDNWSGVILWENANRFCGSPDNSSTGSCTLVDPSVANINTCDQANLTGATPAQVPDYYDLCRWKTQNVLVEHNIFEFHPKAIGSDCTPANGCGYVGVFSEWGSDPSWSPYQGTSVEDNITFHQGNEFEDNTYQGPWRFMILQLGNTVSWAIWRSAAYNQDPGSTLRGN